jgi:hypothetical protein
MENTQGTHVGQVKHSSISHAPTAEGSAFAAVNPPVNPVRAIAASGPGQPIDFVDHTATVSSETRISEIATAIQRPRPRHLTIPVCGVVTIRNSEWKPTKPAAIPKSMTQGLGISLSAHFAMIYNQSEMARIHRRWAVLTTRGTVMILANIPDAERPTNPAAFPPCVQSGMSSDAADLAAVEANGPRLQVAIIPRQWTIAVRLADCVDDMPPTKEGGAA